MAKPFRPYGTPPAFDLDEYKDSFEIWEAQWDIFLELSTINTGLPENERPRYKANILKSCLSKSTLTALLTSGMSADNLNNPEEIIKKLRERCNSGRNRHVWRQQFASRQQREGETIDDWLCDLRSLSSKCEFQEDCCAACEPTRILGQIVYGVRNEEDRRKLLEKGPALQLDDALTTLRTSEAALKQSANLRSSDAPSINMTTKSNYKKKKSDKTGKAANADKSAKPSNGSQKTSDSTTSSGCTHCGSSSSHKKADCPAAGKECRGCGKIGHFASVCRSKEKSKNATKSCGTIRVSSSSTVNRVAAVSSTDSVNILVVTSSNCKSDKVKASFLPDTGSQLDAIPRTLYQRSFKEVALRPAASPETAVGSLISNDGTFPATLTWQVGGTEKSIATTIHVLDKLKEAILSIFFYYIYLWIENYPHSGFSSVTTTVRTDAEAGSTAAPPEGAQSSASPPSLFFRRVLSHSLPGSEMVARVESGITSERKEADLRQLMSEFPIIFDGVCRPMKGPQCHFQLKDDAAL